MGKDQDLLEACRTGNIAVIEKLLSGRLSARVSRGSKAAGGGALSSLSKSLLSLKSANVNCSDNSGDTPLHLAALNGHKEIVTLLLDCEANPTLLDSQDCSALHLAAWNGHTEICNQLLASPNGQALINLQTRDGNTALHFSAQHGHDTTISLLLQKKADPTIRNLEDLSPLDLAAQYDRLEVVRLLVTSHPELVTQRSVQNTPLHLASRNGHRPVVQYLLDSGFPIDARTDKGTALHEAANFCKLDVIKLLLERGIDISVKSQTGCTAEDMLRNIPSKAAEEALSIFKTHIYHQRTPDSDGEKGIVGEAEAELPVPEPSQGTPLPPTKLPPTKLPPPTVTAPAPAPVPPGRKTYLHESLPSSAENATVPPPIPPRQSVRVPDRSDMTGDPGLIPLKVPVPSEKGTDRDSYSDEDRGRLSTSPRDISPSARSPSDQPKKPPRKKPLSFRRPEPPSLSTAEVSSGGGNYVNLDPSVEKANLDAKISAELNVKNREAEPASSASNTVTTQVTENNNEKQTIVQQQQTSSGGHDVLATEKGDNSAPVPAKPDEIAAPGQDVGDDVGVKKDEPSTKPPSSLDIGQSKPEVVPRSPSHPRQPPTPDCPPPSPGTAAQNIHRKIQPMEKRRSKDMETITDSSITGQDDNSSPESSTMADISSTSDTSKASLTPVKEEGGLLAGGMPLHPDRPPKKKPTPLPRKSSLSSETKDLSPSPSSKTSGELIGSSPAENSVVQGDGNKVANHSKVLSKQDQVENQDGGDAVDSSGKRSMSVGSRNTGTVPGEEESNTVEIEGEIVQMRRSVSAGNDPMSWEGHVFAGLLRGSVVGPARDISQQLGGNNVTAAALWKKRKSTLSTFAPVMEEDKDIDPDKILSEIDNIGVGQNADSKKSDDVFDDDSEDWKQIAEIISSYGGRISSSGDYVLLEAQIENLLSSKGENKIQSVGEWLADIGVPQYENTLVANGFDDTDFLGGSIMEDQDLQAIGVDNAQHRKIILEAASSLAKLQPIDPTNLPPSVEEWLASLRLNYYYDTFMSHKYDTMDRVIKLWELELDTVLDITSIGHRKRILASLGERQPETTSPARTRVPSLEGVSNSKSPFDHVDLYRDYTGVKSKVSDTGSDSDIGQGPLLDFENSEQGSPLKGQSIRDSAIHIRAPHLMHYTGTIRQWRHKPEILIKGCCNYTAHYLGSTLVKELKGAMSTQEGIAKLKKSSEVISKIPTIMLSISFKGVKFIDAASKKVVCDHEIANIFCACQDGEHMNFFAYITKDREVGKHYCHVFSVRSRELAGEIILTLGEAFEIAYQMALKERAEQAAEEFDKLSASDGDDSASISSKASNITV